VHLTSNLTASRSPADSGRGPLRRALGLASAVGLVLGLASCAQTVDGQAQAAPQVSLPVTSGSVTTPQRPVTSGLAPTSQGPVTTGSAATPTTPAPLPAGTTTFTGKSGWEMEVAKSWKKFDIPGFDEEAAWYIGGDADPTSNINVLVEKPTIKVTMDRYITLSIAGITRAYPDAIIKSSGIYSDDDREFGRIRYTATISGDKLAVDAYIAQLDEGWALATFATRPDSFDHDSVLVEPYLATLRAID